MLGTGSHDGGSDSVGILLSFFCCYGRDEELSRWGGSGEGKEGGEEGEEKGEGEGE